MIRRANSCSEVISSFLVEKCASSVWLPSDICNSVLFQLDKLTIKYDFYPVTRSWKNQVHDQYDLPNVHQRDWLLISDLFNFNNYRIPHTLECNIILDLAHSSLEYFKFAIGIARSNVNIRLICISFGKGKYLRLPDGGGLGVEPRLGIDLDRQIYSFNQPEYQSAHFAPDLLNGGLYTESSTRIVLPGSKFNQLAIEKLRSQGMAVSDGLYDHLKLKKKGESYLWKTIK